MIKSVLRQKKRGSRSVDKGEVDRMSTGSAETETGLLVEEYRRYRRAREIGINVVEDNVLPAN
jgi:hypothetical protein